MGIAVVCIMAMSGRKAHVARLKRIQGPEMERQVGRALFAGGNIIQVEAQIGLSTGAVSGKGHVPGPVGGYPNSDTQQLANSIETVQKEPLLVEVSANAEYAAAVHDGGSRTGPRPYMDLARDAKRREVEELVVKAVRRIVGRR